MVIRLIRYFHINPYFHFNRKTEWEFRKERFHRLIIPALFLMWVTNVASCFPSGQFSLDQFLHRFALKYASFWKLDPLQGWFLIYMYVYAQLMTSSFLKWHPNHGDERDEIVSLNSKTSHVFKERISKVMLGPIKIILTPAIMLSLSNGLATGQILLKNDKLICYFPGHDRMLNLQSGFWLDWRFHIKYIYLYFLGFAMTSLKSLDLDLILKKYGRVYLFCGIVLILINVSMSIFGCGWIGGPYGKEVECILAQVILSFGVWMNMIGLYATLDLVIIRNSKMMIFLREMAMPFYLLHDVVIRRLRTAMPDHFISSDGLLTITILATLFTGACSFLVVISPGIVRYFFGLPPTEKALLSQWVRGYGPLALLIFIRVIETIIANYGI